MNTPRIAGHATILAKLRATIVARLPENREIVSVFSVIVLFVYSWSLYTSFWRVPSWLYFLNFEEIMVIYAYAFSIDFLESILVLSVCLFFCLIFPQRWWKAIFVSRSLSFVFVLLSSLMLRLYLFGSPYYLIEFAAGQGAWWLTTLLVLIVVTWLLPGFGWLRSFLASFSDRCIIFAYVFVPLSLLSLGIVLFRNIIGF